MGLSTQNEGNEGRNMENNHGPLQAMSFV